MVFALVQDHKSMELAKCSRFNTAKAYLVQHPPAYGNILRDVKPMTQNISWGTISERSGITPVAWSDVSGLLKTARYDALQGAGQRHFFEIHPCAYSAPNCQKDCSFLIPGENSFTQQSTITSTSGSDTYNETGKWQKPTGRRSGWHDTEELVELHPEYREVSMGNWTPTSFPFCAWFLIPISMMNSEGF